jgi:hypothetical protein
LTQPLRAHLRVPRDLAEPLGAALADAGVESAGPEPGDGLVFMAEPPAGEGFAAIEAELLECYWLSRRAAAAGAPVVYVVAAAHLLGQGGVAGGILAGALLSGMRALAMEGAREGMRANVVAFGDPLDVPAVARWVAALLRDESVSGELVRLGAAHLGKVLP